MADCLFCKIVAGEIPSARVHQDERAIVFLDINQSARGHLLIVPRAHHAEFHELGADDLAHLNRVAADLAPALVAAVEADGYNLLLNNGGAAGQEVMHVHLHLIPRWAGDSFFNRMPHRQAGAEELRGTASLIKEALRGLSDE